MNIKWYGHSCFKLSFAQGPYVVTDPFDDHVGYPLCDATADIVTTSHGHGDHNYVESVQGRPTVLNRSGMFTFDDLLVRAVDLPPQGVVGVARRGHPCSACAAGRAASLTRAGCMYVSRPVALGKWTSNAAWGRSAA